MSQGVVVDVEQRVRRYASDVVDGCTLDTITEVRRFGSGERHAVFRVAYAVGAVTADVVVRVASSAEVSECAQAEREAAVLGAVDGIAAPRLIDFRCGGRWFDVPTMCLAFVEGDQRPLAACGDVDLEALGRVVASVHELPVAPLQGVLADPGTIAGYLDSRLEVAAGRLSFVRAPLSADVQHRVRRTWRLVDERAATIRNRPVAASAAAARLLHGDVSGGNVIWSPEPVLIDWEFARLGDPADEIASMFGQHELGSSPREAFWRGYGLRAGAHVVADLRPRVVAWEPVTLFGSALWWLERWTRRAEADRSGEVDAEASRREDHYRDNALRRLDRVEQLLAAVW